MNDFNDKRDEQLIKEREKYEEAYFAQIVDEMIESDSLDKLIASRFKYIENHFDFEPSPEYERLEELYYSQYESMNSSYIDGELQDYIPHDNLEDNLDGYDYPEGPNENLSGIKFEEYEPVYEMLEPDFDDYFDEPEPQEEHYEIPDEYYADLYEELIIDSLYEEYDLEKKQLDELIKVHIEDEKTFLDDLLFNAMEEEHYFERAIDELIFEKIGIDYEPDYFDYDRENNWYSGSWVQDESIINPFDSLGDIDYPEGEKTLDFEFPNIEYYEDEVQKDFEKYERELEVVDYLPDEYIPEPPNDLDVIDDIYEPPEDVDDLRNEELIKTQEILEQKFKEFVSKNDTLDEIIKEKLKEKKFNK